MNKKQIITKLLFGLFFIHFTLVIYYNFNPNNSIINNYIRPVFDQNWQFFAPDPPISSQHLFFKFKDDSNKWSNWINPGYESHKVFDYNRFSYHGKLLHLNAAISHYLNHEIQKIKYSEKYKNASPSNKNKILYKMLMKSDFINTNANYLKRWINWQYKLNPKEIQAVIITKNNQNNIKEITFLPINK